MVEVTNLIASLTLVFVFTEVSKKPMYPLSWAKLAMDSVENFLSLTKSAFKSIKRL